MKLRLIILVSLCIEVIFLSNDQQAVQEFCVFKEE